MKEKQYPRVLPCLWCGKGPHKQLGDQRPLGTDMLLEEAEEKVSVSGESINFHFASVDMEA